MTDFWTNILDFATTTAKRVSTKLLQDFGQVQAAQKADGSLVTESDKWADHEISAAIAAAFPDHGILSEESDCVYPGNEWCWVIDPLDGTTNFTRGIPLWSISMGLLYRGTPVFGYIYLPTINQAFHGFWAGDSGLTIPSGAFLNQNPIHTSTDEIGSNHFFNLCSRSVGVLQRGFPCKIRMLGVASYNFITVAAGSTLGGIESTPKVWDIAAAWVILRAAGGVWVSLKSEPFPLVVGEDYSSSSFPTLVVGQPDLIPVFETYLYAIKI